MKVDFSGVRSWNRLRSVRRDKILAPVGGLFSRYGIWDDVTLEARPAVFIADVFVKPSVRRGELVVDYSVANETDRAVTATATSPWTRSCS